MRLALFTGELSGDIYSFHLLGELKKLISEELEVLGIGGPNTNTLSFFRSIADISELSIMGVVDVLLNIRKLWKLFNRSLLEVQRFFPQAVILVDSPGFNLRFAKALRERGYKGKIIYFIPPTAWIWRSERAEIIRRYCDFVITLFDFEAQWYSLRGVRAYFLGHPLLDILPQGSVEGVKGDLKRPVLACFPGSRRKEVEYLLPIMLDVACSWHGDVLFSKVKNLPLELYNGVSNLYEVPSYVLLNSCDFVLAASGTIAVESLIYEKPAVIIYRANHINYILYKILVNARFISMPNIMLGEELYPELIQGKANPKEIIGRLRIWLEDEGELRKVKEKISLIRGRLGQRGAIGRIARLILNEVTSFS
ncbi:MAG: hypothetical protein NZ900_09305 [Synergistetes bacterium]|nr:hypothetical protein [Synergistota bacterium]MDW8193113.1 hypothetical protein [Synergistota bacterium]